MSTTDNLHHAEGCEGERVETTEYVEHGITTTHCLDCGAHQAKDRTGKTLETPRVTGGLNSAGRGAWAVTMEPAGGAA